MKNLILTAQDARELQNLGGLTITKPIKNPAPYVEGVKIVLDENGRFRYAKEVEGKTTELELVSTPPVAAGDAAYIREPWHYRHDPPGEGTTVLLAADLQEDETGHKWASPVSMPEAAAVRYVRVVSLRPVYGEGVAEWEICLQIITKETALAIDAGTVGAFTTGTCKHCGQSIALPEAYDTQEDADDAAGEMCSCPSANIARRKRLQVEAAKDKVRQLFGEGAEELGFRPLAGEGAVDLLERTVEMIALGPISSATINVRGQCKAKLTVSTKGKIKVSRSEVNSCDLEAGE